ncbi:hypothetical protein YPPY88_2591, partial [Yersinia pestis PY-88]
MFSHFYAT